MSILKSILNALGALPEEKSKSSFGALQTPMVGDFDLHDGFRESASARLFGSFPDVNTDGTPMLGPVDINGNPYGVTRGDSFESTDTYDSPSWTDDTSSHDDAWSSHDDSWSSADAYSSHDSWSSDDSWSSGSSFD